MSGRSAMEKNKKRTGEGFRDRVLRIVRKIPEGKTLSYGSVARQAGNPKAARAVGAIMKANTDPLIPCHRVVRSNGSPGGYNRGGETEKVRILALERSQKRPRR